MIRKFFDTAIAEPATQTAEQPSIAALLAKHGVQNNGEMGVATPISITPEKKEEPAPAQPTPAAPANEASPAEPASPETQKLTEEPKSAEPQKEIQPPKVQSWQEVLKQQPDTKVILKELGFDDKTVQLMSKLKTFDPKIMGLVDAYTEGKHVDYLRELTTDYSKMTAEEVMKHQLRQDYPTASRDQLEALFKREVVKAYSLDSEDPDEQSEGRLLLEAKADKHRASMIANQQNYLLPKAPEPKAPEPDLQAQKQQQDFQTYQKSVSDDNYTKNIFSSNRLKIGEGENEFSFPVNPKALTDILFDADVWANKFFTPVQNPDGSKYFVPDVKKQMIVAGYLEYGDAFLDAYAQHWKSLGGKSAIKPIENAKDTEGGSPAKSDVAPTSPAEAMAKSGRYNPGGGYQ